MWAATRARQEKIGVVISAILCTQAELEETIRKREEGMLSSVEQLT
jgi:hypothetical protein